MPSSFLIHSLILEYLSNKGSMGDNTLRVSMPENTFTSCSSLINTGWI